MITKINGLNVKNNPHFTGKDKIVRKTGELVMKSVEEKSSSKFLNKLSIKFKMLKMKFKTPNSRNPIFDRPIKEEIKTVQTFGQDNEKPTREIVRSHLWETISPNHETRYSGRLSEFELKKLIATLTEKELTPVKVPPPPCRIGYSDSKSQSVRDKIREHIWNKSAPDYEQLHSGRLSEYELKKMVVNLTKPPKIEIEKLFGLYINNMEQVQEDAYRGQSLVEKRDYLFKLKDAGIRTVIDLAGYKSYEKACKEAGLGYKKVVMDSNFWNEPAFKCKERYVRELNNLYDGFYSTEEIAQKRGVFELQHKVETEKFIDKFIDYIETINKGNFYIGCSYGTFRTDDALILDQYFNPSCSQFKTLKPKYYYLKGCMRDLYKNLSDSDKRRLGFYPEFEEKLKKKLDI